MNDIIRLLPDKVANQIAAGEVIQRPASVVKELVENAVDAGAKKITIVIGDSGRTLIQCVDDGKGMSEVDARMSFERHATSKIASAADLEELITMGFRGEALASIAAVARVEMRTRLKGHDIGTRLDISGGHVESQQPDASTPEGTNIMVKDLFFNVPARRKFLKKDSVEMGHISREFERLALVNPGVELTLVHNGVTVSNVRGGEGMLNRICGLFGRGLDKTLVAVATDTSIVKIDGFIGLPEHSRRRGALQYLTVNGRNMKHPLYHKAILLCYEGLISADLQPNYFINFTVEPSTIDVNIHPTKNEVKFENEQAIRQILSAAVREALGKSNAVPAIDFNREDSPEIPTFNPVAGPLPGDGSQPGYNPFRQNATRNDSMRRVENWEKLFEDFNAARNTEPVRKPMQAELDLDFAKAPEAVHAMQLRNKYILTPTRDGLMIIDQHRAHKRILYERYLKAQSSDSDGRMASQRIMFGQVLRLTPSQSRLLETILPKVADSGFDLAPLGDNAWSVLAAPPLVSEGSVSDMLIDLLTTLEETGEFKTANLGESLASRDHSIRESLALAMAKAGAVRTGQPLGADEIERITSELMRLSSPAYTPDGQRVFIVLTLEDIARSFG